MTHSVRDRAAKLLRLALSTGPDGEKLAALDQLSALATANDLDWDRVLANGNGSALDEEAASRICWEGHARGVSETEQRLRPARDWTPATDTSAEVGDDAQRLCAIFEAAVLADQAGT
jgi:hypothetical protein